MWLMWVRGRIRKINIIVAEVLSMQLVVWINTSLRVRLVSNLIRTSWLTMKFIKDKY